MPFSLEKALANAGAVVARRKNAQVSTISYVMYCSNQNNDQNPKQIKGYTMCGLKKIFRDNYKGYKFAVITKINNPQPIAVFNREWGACMTKKNGERVPKFIDPRERKVSKKH